jgi:mannose-6-phosphate isomerase-like protein (cupin superfamily)
MKNRSAAIGISLLFTLAASAQEPVAAQALTSEQVDLYFGDRQTAPKHAIRGTLEVRELLTRYQPGEKLRKGAVLRLLNSLVYATLPPRASTSPVRLSGQQEIFFVVAGQGTINAAGKGEALEKNVAVLVPANLEFTIQNSGDQPLEMYLLNELTPAGFQPKDQLVVRNENTQAISASDDRWSHIVKPLFARADGLATLRSVSTVRQDAQTIGRPVVRYPGSEEIWTSLEGTSVAFLGNQLRKQGPGVAYLAPADGQTPHSNINDRPAGQVRFLRFSALPDEAN